MGGRVNVATHAALALPQLGRALYGTSRHHDRYPTDFHAKDIRNMIQAMRRSRRKSGSSPAPMERLFDTKPTGLRDSGPQYIEAFVTFLDILGFRQMVADEPAQRINEWLNALHVFSHLAQRRRRDYATADLAPMTLQFSDSIIRIQPIPGPGTGNVCDLLVGEITALLLIQGNLACNGIFVRGGLTFGDVCVRESRVFGPAFNRAYAIESNIARYPRILVDRFLCFRHADNPLASRVSSATFDAAQEELSTLLEQNEDGQFALEYLTYLAESKGSDDATREVVLRAHRDAIIKARAALDPAKAEEPFAKLQWLASYHNRWVARAYDRLDQQTHERTGRGLCVK